MKNLIYLSRAFVEFGPFPLPELLDFQKRGLIRETDYVREEGDSHWHHANPWLVKASAAAVMKKIKALKPVAEAVAEAPAPAPAARKATAAKAAKKPVARKSAKKPKE